MIHERISPLLVNGFLIIIILAITITLVILGRGFLVPMVFAGLLSLCMYRLGKQLNNHKIPRSLAYILGGIITIAVFVGIIGILGLMTKNFVSTLPDYQPIISTNLTQLTHSINTTFHTDISQLIQPAIKNIVNLGGQIIPQLLSSITNITSTITLSIILSILLLAYRDRIKESILAMGGTKRETLSRLAKDYQNVVPKYLWGLLMSITILSVLNSFGFWIIGIPSPIFWGCFTAVLNIIPYLGTTIGFGLVILFSLLVLGPISAIYTVIMFMIIQFIDNNITTPMIMGSQVSLNALISILGIIIGGAIWGIPGMIIALPILGMIKITAHHVPALRPLEIMMGNEKL